MSHHEELGSRTAAALEHQGHWSFTAPSATMATQSWREPSTLHPLRTVSTIEAPSLRGEDALGPAPRPDDAGPPEPSLPQEPPADRLDQEAPLEDLLPWELSEEELRERDEAQCHHPDLQVHPSSPSPESTAWRAPVPVGDEPGTISFEDGPEGQKVVGRRPARSELSDPMKILQGLAGLIVMIVIAFMG